MAATATITTIAIIKSGNNKLKEQVREWKEERHIKAVPVEFIFIQLASLYMNII